MLLPLDKGRAGQDAPTFVVEVVYLQRTSAWTDKGRRQSTLPALDLPVSRTGLRLFYPPQFQVALQPGVFRIDAGPWPVRRGTAPPVRRRRPRPRPPARVDAPPTVESAALDFSALVDRFRSESGERTVVGHLFRSTSTFPTSGRQYSSPRS